MSLPVGAVVCLGVKAALLSSVSHCPLAWAYLLSWTWGRAPVTHYLGNFGQGGASQSLMTFLRM